MDKYRNREHAGQVLASRLGAYDNRNNTLILALPRGGVPVAFEIAKSLQVPMDVFIIRKLGVPGHEELAMGAIAMGGAVVFNEGIIDDLDIPQAEIQAEIEREKEELQRRERVYRGNHTFPPIKNKTIILVDDGIATGASMRAAIMALRHLQPTRIVVAVPVADKEISKEIQSSVDEFICPLQPDSLYAVGAWYDDFSQTEDLEVHALLQEAKSL
jgi:putative phosphoribosyl transferase